VAIPALVERLQNTDASDDCMAAPRARARIGAAAVPALRGLLAGPGSALRQTACWTLGKIGPDAGAAIPSLVVLLGDTDQHVRVAAASALGQIGPAAVHVLCL
jgi:HEAT repeat protein